MTILASHRDDSSLARPDAGDRFERVHLGFIPGLVGTLAITNVVSAVLSLMA
jgi:hypothetical protein